MDSFIPIFRDIRMKVNVARERYTHPSQPSNIQVISDFYLMSQTNYPFVKINSVSHKDYIKMRIF